MPKPDLVILVDIPALDRLVAYLESADQTSIDAATAAIEATRARFAASEDALGAAIVASTPSA